MGRLQILSLVLLPLLCCGRLPLAQQPATTQPATKPSAAQRIEQYARVRLTTDVAQLSAGQRQMIPLLIRAARIMDDCFWYEAYGDRQALIRSIDDPATRRFAQINYGPWDRLNGNEPFVEGVGEKPPGANFYPVDMTKEEFAAAALPGKDSQYTFIRRNQQGQLIAVPYRQQFADAMQRAADLLQQAAELADEPGLRRYLQLRAGALLTDDYQPSDIAWLEMKDNTIDVVIGPIENYEDQLFGYKTAHEAYVLIKDKQWSQRLARYAQFLPELQASLPVPPPYRQETPGTDTELNAYDVIYYAGDCNAGSKTIAINLPNDEQVQLQKGTRRLQLKNAMRAKFDKIMMPIADELIDRDQLQHVTFDAFFSNTMFHEVAHGLGIKNTLGGNLTVREALKEHHAAIEEGKADILGLHMINQLHDAGEIEGDLNDYYVTFLAGIFRSVRFGTSSAHGKANMIRFNFFRQQGAFERNAQGRYRVNPEKFRQATRALSAQLLRLQGDGDYAAAGRLIEQQGIAGPGLQAELERLTDKGIPVDVVFEQGTDVLGL